MTAGVRAGDKIAVDETALRHVCGLFVTGVTVITCEDNGVLVGTTVNSFTSVSLDPPLVLFCLHRQSRLNSVLATTRQFAVNVLSSGQQTTAWAFAGRAGETPHASRSHRSTSGHPVLSTSLAHLVCTVTDLHPGGDHLIVVGRVEEIGVSAAAREPLVFFRGAMASLEHRPGDALPIVDG